MKAKIRAVAGVLCALAGMLLVAAPGALAAGGHQAGGGRTSGSLLYVQQAEGGELVRVGPGAYRLVFQGVSPTVDTFTDRPHRRGGEQGLSAFVHGWAGAGFAADPPNAALVIHGAPASHDVAMLTLSHPRYDRRAGRLIYAAKPLRGVGAKSLAAFSRRGDPLQSRRFGSASLFVDDGGEENMVPVTLQVTVQPFELGEANLEIAPGSDARWSLGRPDSRSSGLFFNSQPGVPALGSLLLTPTQLNFRAAPSNAPVTFSLSLLVETTSEILQMNAAISPSIQITATTAGVTSTWTSGLVEILLD